MHSASGPAELEPTADSRWLPTLRGLRSEALDCLQTSVAIIADQAYGLGAHLALGCRLRFPVGRPDETVRAQRSLEERLDEASELLGMRVRGPQGPMGAPEVRRHLVNAGTAYIVADAFALPWLPYAGRRHMAHSFLLELSASGYTAVDAYHNDTEWGPARPGVWRLSADGLDAALAGGALVISLAAAGSQPRIDRLAALAANGAAARAAAADIERYAAVVRSGLDRPEGIERLVLDIWLLSRERLLHACWLDDGAASSDVKALTQAWPELAARAYLTMRRAQRGMPVNGVIVDDLAQRLHADAQLAARLAAIPAVAGPDQVAAAVRQVLQATLQLDDAAVEDAATLRALPGFDSFKLVEIIDRLERSLCVRLPSDLAAGDLLDVSGLCRLFGRATPDRAGGQP
jgi:acyl carrier protein